MQGNNFLPLYRRLREWSDDDPSDLLHDCELDESLEELCVEVFHAATEAANEMEVMESGVFTASASVIEALRDYELRFEAPSLTVWHRKVIRDMTELIDTHGDLIADQNGKNVGMGELLLQYMDSISKNIEGHWADAGNHAIQIGKLNSDYLYSEVKNCEDLVEVHGGAPSSFNVSTAAGLSAIPSFLSSLADHGIDAEGFFRRRALLNSVAIPEHAMKRGHNQETTALLELIAQARRAYLAGSHAGAVALLRALIEHLLLDYYHSTGTTLVEVINNARNLPVNRSDIHELRKLANGLLHGSNVIVVDKSFSATCAAERKIAAMLELSWKLVEGIPE